MLAVILAIAALMRFWGYASFSFSNDELSALYRLRFHTFTDLVDKGFYVDGHPGGVQVFLWFWIKLFGTSEASLRFPFVIAGILSVLFAYLIAHRWFGRASGLLVASAMAFLEFPLLYSQIARPYGSGVFLVLLMVYAWTRLLFSPQTQKRRKLPAAALYALATAACMYNHYFSFLMAIIIGATGLFYIRRNDVLYYLGAGATAIVLFLPHVYITLNHLSIGGVGTWLGKPDTDWLFRHIFFIFNYSWIVLLATVLVSTYFFVNFHKQIRRNRFVVISLVWFILPFLIGFFYSRLVSAVLMDSVLIFSFPFLLMALFAAAGDNIRKPFQIILAVFLAIGVFSTVVEKRYYHSQHFGEFKGVAHTLANWHKTYGADSLTVAVCVNHPYYLDYYLERDDTKIAYALTNCEGRDGLVEMNKIVQKCTGPYFAYAWLKPASPMIADIIRAVYPYVITSNNYNGLSEVTLFSKIKPLVLGEAQPYKVDKESYSNATIAAEFASRCDSTLFCSAPSSFRFDSLMEYGPIYTILIAEPAPSFVRASIRVYGGDGISGAHLVISAETETHETIRWESSEFELFTGPAGWYGVIHTFSIPANLPIDAKLNIYVWNPGKKILHIDDLKVELYH